MFFTKITTYVREAIGEMKKVVWPNKKQTTHYTIAVFGLSVGIAVFFAVIDNVFSKLLAVLIK